MCKECFFIRLLGTSFKREITLAFYTSIHPFDDGCLFVCFVM